MFTELLYLGHAWWNFCAFPLFLYSNWLFLWSFPMYFLTLFVLTHCGNDEGVVLPPEITTVVLRKLGWLFLIISVVFYKKFYQTIVYSKKLPDISEMVFDSIRLFLLISNANGASQSWMCSHSSVFHEGEALNNYRLQCSFGTHCIASTKLHLNDLDWVTRKEGSVLGFHVFVLVAILNTYQQDWCFS